MADLDLSKLRKNYQTVSKWTSGLPGTSYSYTEINRDPVTYNPVEYKPTEYKTYGAGTLKQNLAKEMRPSYDLQAKQARQNVRTQNTAADVDAASRGIGSSTWVSDMKNRNYNALNQNLAGIEANYASNLYGNLFNRMSEQEARKLQNDQFNAGNLLNTDISNSQGKYNADVWNSESGYSAAMANYQNQLALQQADLARNLELAQAMGVTARAGGNGNPRSDGNLVPYMDGKTGMYKFGYSDGNGGYIEETNKNVIESSLGKIGVDQYNGVTVGGQDPFLNPESIRVALNDAKNSGAQMDENTDNLRKLLNQYSGM